MERRSRVPRHSSTHSVTDMRSALEVYGHALSAGGLLRQRDDYGSVTPLPLHVWTSEEAPGDAGLLARCRGPVLDVGCGPGRLAAALMAHWHVGSAPGAPPRHSLQDA